MQRRVRYGVQVEFTVDDVLSGGPSRAEIRRSIREALAQLALSQGRFASLTEVRTRYLHEATSTQEKKPK